MHKYAQICKKKYAINMHKYATICKASVHCMIAKQAKICKLYAQICTNMQYMQSRISYAEYARICTPHFADGHIQDFQPTNRKCCVNRKVESGALKNFFLGSESVLLHSTLER